MESSVGAVRRDEDGKLRYTAEFLSKYEGREPTWGPIGAITLVRTYLRRRFPDDGNSRLETWTEAVVRILEGNFNIIPNDPTATEHEMTRAFDLMWNLYWLPAGRGMWISGTEFAEQNGSSLNNCWGIVAMPMEYFKGGPKKNSFPFVLGMDLLMLGGGIGINATDEEVSKFPKVRREVKLVVVCDPKHPNVRELDAEDIPPRGTNHTYIRVADSRRGWTDALRVVADSHWKHGGYDYTLVLDVSDVRAAGEPIRGFGGTSSGPGPLVQLLRAFNDLLNSRVGEKLSSVDVTDLFNYIGKCVVAGNVRRSAELAMGSPSNSLFINMKLDEAAFNDRRWASNNSIMIDDEFEDFDPMVAALAQNGEPGLINMYRGQNYGRGIDGPQPGIDALVKVVNPCAEIFLENGECCNLCEVFPAVCLRDGVDIKEALRYATSYAKRVTFTKHEWEIITEVVERNRRLGITLGGWDDFKMVLADRGYTVEDRKALVDELYRHVVATDIEISAALGCNRSNKLTATQPSGTKSKLVGGSSGRHRHWSAFLHQRIRFSTTDPMIDVLTAAGFRSEPDLRTPNTLVFSFPVKAPTADLPGFKAAHEDSLEDQMIDQMELQDYWADNSVSSTLTFRKDEVPLIADLLRKYKFKSTSLLPVADHGYEQAPWEAITKEKYEEMQGEIVFWPTLADFADARLVELDGADCEGGSCPIR